MEFSQCPYDQTEIEAESYEGGVYLVACSICGAKWESHYNWMARVQEPNWEIVDAFQEIASLQTTRD